MREREKIEHNKKITRIKHAARAARRWMQNVFKVEMRRCGFRLIHFHPFSLQSTRQPFSFLLHLLLKNISPQLILCPILILNWIGLTYCIIRWPRALSIKRRHTLSPHQHNFSALLTHLSPQTQVTQQLKMNRFVSFLCFPLALIYFSLEYCLWPLQVALCALFVTVSANGLHGPLLAGHHYGGHLAHNPYALASLHGPLLHGHGHGHLAAPAFAHTAIRTGDYAKVATVAGIAPGVPVAPVVRSVHAPLIAGHHAPLLAGHHGALLAPHGHLAGPYGHGHGHLASPYLPYGPAYAPHLAYPGHHGLAHGAILSHGHHGALLAPHGLAHGAHLIKKK